MDKKKNTKKKKKNTKKKKKKKKNTKVYRYSVKLLKHIQNVITGDMW